MKPMHQITSDAVTIRGIIDYLEKSVEPATLHELAMTQHISNSTALRLCRILEKASIIEHPTVTRIVLGTPQEVPQLAWALTKPFFLGGCCYDAEKLAGGDLRMVGGQLCRQTYRARHREERCKNQRRYNKEHRDALMVTKLKRDEYIKRIVRQIELNDDPESLFYVENFEEEAR